MNIRLTQIDGALPNIALMKLAHYHRACGRNVVVTRHIERQPDEPFYDAVYASSIFKFSEARRDTFLRHFPNAIVGGTGTDYLPTVEDRIGKEYEYYDYSGYPDFDASIGFTQRGCRLSCKFCVVPKKEGKPRSVNTIWQIYRGDPWPKKLHLLDNDFFGNPEWRARIEEIKEGGFRVCLSQGINVRMITDESAAALASIQYRDTKFSRRMLYTAWDNLGDEKIFFNGVERLRLAGISSKHLMSYMLIGFDARETWDAIWYRFRRMTELGINPYPMVYDRSRKDLLCFQRWVITGLYRWVPWPDYERSTKTDEMTAAWRREYESSAPKLVVL